MTKLFLKKVINHKNIMLIIMFIIISIFIHSQIVSAKEQHSNTKTFTTIEVYPGDTLSSIALTYKKPSQDLDSYIQEVISMNNLTGETIHSGCYLVIPIYHNTEDLY